MKPIKSNGVTVNLITEADINFGGGQITRCKTKHSPGI